MNDLNDLMPAQEKLEWVTPKISRMEAEQTEDKNPDIAETYIQLFGPS